MSYLHIETPYVQSNYVGQQLNADVWLKLDSLQPCGSFKARGMGVACQKYAEAGATAFVSSSGGNAGLAVAWAGRLLDIPVTVVVPESTKEHARNLIANEGAKVIVHGESWIEAHTLALELSAENHTALLHPFENPWTWEGHATMISEMAASGPKPDAVVLSVGGGGLLIGVADGLAANGWGDVPILAVETEGAASLHRSVVTGEHVMLDKIDTIATTLGAKQVADRAYELGQSNRVTTATVTDQQAVSACAQFLDEHRILVEPACGAAIATVYAGYEFLQDKKRIALIVCGGAGVTNGMLQNWQKTL